MRETGPHTAASLLILGAAVWLYRRLHVWPDTPDGVFHLHRVRALTEAWQEGVLYPRWFPDFAFGYGHPIFNFYAPAYYPLAGLPHWLGMDLLTANRLALSLLFALSGLACYALLRRWTSFWPALSGSAVFLFFPYRLYDLFVRGALPEFAAFLWPPLLLYGYDRLLRSYLTERDLAPQPTGLKTWLQPPHWLIFSALAWAGLILTHNLTALMAGIVWLILGATVMVYAWLQRDTTQRDTTQSVLGGVALRLIIPLLVGSLLSGFYIAPVALEAGWVGIGSGPRAPGYANHAVAWANLWSFAPLAYAYPNAAAPTVPLAAYVGIFSLVGAFLAFAPWAKPYRARLVAALIFSGLTLWLTTTASLPFWDLTAPILGKLQFPWRWQTILALSVAALVSLSLQALLARTHTGQSPWLRRVVQLGTGAIAVYTVVYAIAGLPITPAPYQAQDLTRAHMWAFDADHGQVGATWTGEFLPAWVAAPRWTIGRAPETDPDNTGSEEVDAPPISIIVRPIHLGYQFAVYTVQIPTVQIPTVQIPTALALAVPHFYYPAWQAALGGAPAPLRPTGDLAWLTVDAPPGEHVLMLRWASTPGVALGRILTGAGWLLVGGLLWAGAAPYKRSSRRLHLLLFIGWLIPAVLGVAAMTNLPVLAGMGVRSPIALDADFGYVHLSAAEIPQAPIHRAQHAPASSEALKIVLYWTARHSPVPIQAFVHLVDANGALIAQYDAPIGGAYLPVERFRLGLPVTSQHPLTLPPATSAGVYTLLAGAYFAHAPDQPLWAEAADAPRLEIGQVEVRP